MNKILYLPLSLLSRFSLFQYAVVLICLGTCTLTAQVNLDWCQTNSYLDPDPVEPGCDQVIVLNIDAGQQTTDGGTVRNTYITAVGGSCEGILGTNAYRIKYNTTLNRWEIEWDQDNGSYPPYDGGVIFHSSEATAPNPPNMATGNWTQVPLGDGGNCSGLAQLDGNGTQAAASNTSPSIAVDDLQYTAGENSGNPVQIDGSASASDVEANWDGGSLTVQITANNEANDEISISQTGLTLSGTNVQDGGTTFGTISESSGTANDGTVTNGDLLTINFNSNATNARVQTLVRAIAYRSTSATPSTSTRTVTYVLSDDTEGTTETAAIDVCIPPTVSSIAKADSDPTNASSVDFTVTFSESVTGVDVFDFVIDASGITGASLSSAAGGGTTYTVSVNTGSGDGTLSIDFDADNSGGVTNGSCVSTADFTGGEAYTIDKTAPTVSTFTPADDATGVAVDANLVINFSENVVKGSSGNIVIRLVSDDSPVQTIPVTDAAVTISGGEVTINPSSDLAEGTNYYVEVASSCFEDAVGNNFAGISGNTIWNFQTIVSLPTVTVAATTDNVSEDGVSNLVFRFSRTLTSGSLVVNFSIAGTAADSDYSVSGATSYDAGTNTGTITFPDGIATVDLTVDPTTDSLIEADETVIVKVENP